MLAVHFLDQVEFGDVYAAHLPSGDLCGDYEVIRELICRELPAWQHPMLEVKPGL